MNAFQKLLLAITLFIGLIMAIGVTIDDMNHTIGNEHAPQFGTHISAVQSSTYVPI
jgi:hypothetical protein